MLNKKWEKIFSRWFKLRFAVLYPLGIWAVISGYSTDKSMMHSIWYILLGLAIRSWANCYAIKSEKLTTSGPYAYVRHPLYFGSFLIMIGFLVMLNVHWFISLILIFVVIGVVYRNTIRKEEKLLHGKFGQEYIDYRKSVGALFPTIFAFKGGQKWGPSLGRYLRSQEYKLVIWMIISVIAFHVKGEFLLEHEPIDIGIFGLIVVAIFLGMIDVVGGIFKKHKRPRKADNVI